MLLNVFCFKWWLYRQETSIHTWIIMFTVTSHLGMAKNKQISEQCHKNFCIQNVLFRFVFDKTVHSKFQTLAFQHSWPFCEKCHWCPFLETWPIAIQRTKTVPMHACTPVQKLMTNDPFQECARKGPMFPKIFEDMFQTSTTIKGDFRRVNTPKAIQPV